MALQACMECGGCVSNEAVFCPHCGCPVAKERGFQSMRYQNGDWYEGECRGNLRHGEGTYHFANGDIYSGKYEANERVSHGAYYDAQTGKTTQQLWKNGMCTPCDGAPGDEYAAFSPRTGGK